MFPTRLTFTHTPHINQKVTGKYPRILFVKSTAANSVMNVELERIGKEDVAAKSRY
jgi:hypothetical protein